MAHYHHCAKCGVQVSVCSDDSCQSDPSHPNYGQHWCSEHHEDPAYRVEPGPAPSRINHEAIAEAVVRKINEG